MSSIDGAKARKLLRLCAASAERLPSDESGEALHDFRVGLRRLRTELKAAGGLKKHRRRLKDVFKTTGPWRDAQVEADWTRDYARKEDRDWALAPLLRELDEALAQGRSTALPQLERSFAPEAKKLGKRLGKGLRIRLRKARLRELAGDAAARLRAVAGLEDVKKLHKARIAVKKLRYALESARRGGSAVKRLRELQGLLGDLHDRDSVCLMLDAAARAGIAEPGALLRARKQAESEKKALFENVKKRWLGTGARRLANIV